MIIATRLYVRHVSVSIVLTLITLHSQLHAGDRLPIPSDPAQQKVLAIIKEVYGEEYTSAQTDEQKRALAKKLLAKAAESQDSTNRYVLLRVARDVATNGGDGLGAFQAIDQMETMFQVDAVTIKQQVLSSLSEKATLPAEHKSVAEQALLLVDQAVAQDAYETAGKLVKMALAAARRARNRELVKDVVASSNALDSITSAYESVKEAANTLEVAPTDATANLIVGEFRCLVKGDWEKGLPMLALGNDPDLKELAVKELGQVREPAEQIALGDGWWDLAEQEDGIRKTRLMERATHWYRKALPELAGLMKEKAAKRIGDAVASAGPTKGASDKIDLLARINLEEHVIHNPTAIRRIDTGLAVVTTKGSGCVVELQYSPKQPYALEMDVVRVSSYRHAIMAFLTCGKGACEAQIDGRDNGKPFSSLSSLGALPRPLPRVDAPVIVPGQDTTLRWEVTDNGIAVLVNGRLLLKWTGNPTTLRRDKAWGHELRQPANLHFAVAENTEYRVSRIDVFPLGPSQ